MYTHTLENS